MGKDDIEQRCARTRAYLEKLDNELFGLLLELDILELHTCADIEASYLAQIGRYECDLFEWESRVARVKRKVHLVQRSLKAGIWPDAHQVDWQVANEYRNHDERLALQRENVQVAIRHCTNLDDIPFDARAELEDLHAILLRRLHPDLNHRPTEESEELLAQAREAYRTDNLDGLRTLEEQTRDTHAEEAADDDLTLDQLLDQVSLAELQISFTRSVIEQIKRSFPYVQKPIVDDPGKIEASIDDIQLLIKDYEEEYSWYTIELETLLDTSD